MRYAHLFVFVSAAVLSGCASTAVKDDFGKSAAQMIRAQTSNPATLTGNQDRPVEGIDPQVANGVLESMRKDIPDRAVVKHDVMINVGNQQNSGGNQ
jgi:type IV pilus biogenesis protein CpaD/CtpE